MTIDIFVLLLAIVALIGVAITLLMLKSRRERWAKASRWFCDNWLMVAIGAISVAVALCMINLIVMVFTT